MCRKLKQGDKTICFGQNIETSDGIKRLNGLIRDDNPITREMKIVVIPAIHGMLHHGTDYDFKRPIPIRGRAWSDNRIPGIWIETHTALFLGPLCFCLTERFFTVTKYVPIDQWNISVIELLYFRFTPKVMNPTRYLKEGSL